MKRTSRPTRRARIGDVLGFEPRGIIFDMDGVLADTEPINERALAIVLARRGAHLGADEYRGLIGLANDASWSWTIKRFGLTERPEQLGREYEEAVVPLLGAGAVPLPGVLDLVGALRREGSALALASSSPRVAVDAVLAALGLAGAFQVVVVGRDVAAGKPAPDIFLLAARRLGLPPASCVVIEDSPHGVEAARRAGMRCIALRSRYHQSDALPADVVVDSLESLLA